MLYSLYHPYFFVFFFFFNDTATTEIYTLSLHDALPIYGNRRDRQRRGAQSEVVRECRRAEAGRRAPQYGRQEERAGDTANELADDVANRLAGAHRAGREHAHSDGGVKMPARHRAVGKGEGHDGQAVGEGNRDETRQADTVADHGSGAGADEY